MQSIIYILLLNMFLSCCVSEHTHKDHEHTHDTHKDQKCNDGCCKDCHDECPSAKECSDTERDCGSTPNENPFCPPDRICIAANCECVTQDSTGQDCDLFCNVECGETEKFCDGGKDEKNCKLPDECVQRYPNSEGGLCPGYCPVTCESDQIKCPVPNDENGCAQAPVCEAKGKDNDGVDCPGVCSVTCKEDEIVCPGTVLENGCKEADTCVFRGRNNDGGLCPGLCPVECRAHSSMLCTGLTLKDGCKAADTCNVMAKGLTGKVCPANSDSHECPKACKEDEFKCPAFEDQEGCKGEALCVKKTVDDAGEYCPSHSVCHTPCKVGELSCAGGMDENGCKKPDTCLPMSPGHDGELCPLTCPGECKENEIKCEGMTTDDGCKSADICEPVGVKLIAPNPEEIGKPCPGFCPIHKCEVDEIKCPSQLDPCFHCKTEDVCLVAAKNIDGAFCDVESASHNCPRYCNEAAGEVLCPAYEDSRGCKPKALCMARSKDDNDNYCPKHSVCPMVCTLDEMLCPNGDDINGCKKADSCLARGKDLDKNLCPVECPPVCNENQNLCSGEIMANGCNSAGVCVDHVVGNDGAHCVTVCPTTCKDNKEYVPGGTDENGCPMKGACRVPMTFSDWTNHAVCVANGADISCGPGTQVQVQTCTDGEIEKCTEYQITRTVTCAAAGSELPACPEVSLMSTACRSANGDVKFEEHSTPFIFWDNVWSPICGHYFWDNQVGATKFCQKMMYKEGEWAKSGNSYSTDAFRVGECNADDDWDTKCTGGCNDYEAGGQCSNAWFNNGYCNKDDDVAIKIKCNQPLTANAEVANPSCSECTCTDYINENGFGACGKEQDAFGGLVTCYVNQPSSCTDLVRSSTDPDKLISAEACIRDIPYVCDFKGCLWSDYGTEGGNWGYFSKTEEDCFKCQHECNQDTNCGGVECGEGYCSWWKAGSCSSEDDFDHEFYTCHKQCNAQIDKMTCSASSEHSTNWGCENAIDGNSGTDWATKGEGTGAWIKLDFGDTYTVRTIKIKHRSTGNSPASELFKGISLEFSDGKKVEYTLNNISYLGGLVWNEVVLTRAPISDYVKITATSVYGAINNGFSDIQVFGCVNGSL